MPDDDLPDFKPGKCYGLRGGTLNNILAVLRTNRPRGTEGGGVTVDVEADGSYVSAPSDSTEGGGGGGEYDNLPGSYNPKLIFFLKSATRKRIEEAAKKNATYATEGGGLHVDERNDDGVWLSTSDD